MRRAAGGLLLLLLLTAAGGLPAKPPSPTLNGGLLTVRVDPARPEVHLDWNATSVEGASAVDYEISRGPFPNRNPASLTEKPLREGHFPGASGWGRLDLEGLGEGEYYVRYLAVDARGRAVSLASDPVRFVIIGRGSGPVQGAARPSGSGGSPPVSPGTSAGQAGSSSGQSGSSAGQSGSASGQSGSSAGQSGSSSGQSGSSSGQSGSSAGQSGSASRPPGPSAIPALALSPPAATVALGASARFEAPGGAATSWRVVEGPTAGTVDATGVYLAPSVLPGGEWALTGVATVEATLPDGRTACARITLVRPRP